MRSTFSSWTMSLRLLVDPPPDPAAVKADLEKLERIWQMIQAVISDAEKRGTAGRLARLHLSDLRRIALDAEDVLEEWRYEMLRAEVEGGAHRKRKPGEGSSVDLAVRLLAGDAWLRDRMARQIGGIMKRYDEIGDQGYALGWGNWDGDRRRRGDDDRPPSSSLVDEGYVFDREEYKETLVDYLVDDCATSQLSVIPIVGMGLMGKTTLVQLVYEDPKVKRNFHSRVWVSLRRDSDLMNLLQSVTESLTSKPCSYSQLDAIQRILQQCLMGKRFLLVLDDVCLEHLRFWNGFKSSIRAAAQGSVILITTKIGDVAERTKTVEEAFYLFESISDDNCWLLFKKYAFVGQDSTAEGPDMEGIRKKVIEISEGMPLVAKVLGISFNVYGREIWMYSMEDVIDKEILPKLESSYQLLPDYLKPCLLYCSLFPKGHLFHKDRLVRLWMAQGLIRSKNRERPEDIGLKYFGELLSRSFFLPSTTHKELYSMPNLICDLVYSISSNEHGRVEDVHSLPSEARHLSLILHECESMESFYAYSSLRSFLVIRPFPCASIMHLRNQIQDKMFLKLNRLRSLDLSYTSITTVPESIGYLKHLRFLALNHTKIKTLPESIHNLYNLQILELKGCSRLRELPRGIGSLINLRYLDTDSDHLPILGPLQIQKLTSLQMLPALNLHKGNEFCGIQELQDLTNLRELGIFGLCNVTNLDDARKANLQNKTNLKILKLIWPANDTAPSSEQFGDSDHQDFLVSTDETGKGDELDVQDYRNATGSVDKQHTDHERSSSCDVDDTPGSMDIPDEQESSNSSVQLGNRINNMDIQDSVLSDAAVSEKDLLESLRPCATIEMLCIKSYHGPKFPNWIGDSSFTRLIMMELIDCRCVILPPVGCLRLKFLSIDGMLVELVGTGFRGTGDGIAFPKLETLSFYNMNKWERWDGMKQGDFPNLKKLCLFNCPQLRRLPNHLSSLERLEVERCMELTEIPNFPSLQVLELLSCDGLTALPTLTSLCSLTIMYCKKLEFLPPLPQLEKLWIEDCEQLTSIVFCSCCLPPAVSSCRISDLKILQVANCRRLFFTMEPLANIQKFSIDGCLILSKLDKTHGDGN